MSADEIFVLILVAVCAGALLAMELHSRRQKKALDASIASAVAEGAAVPEPVVIASEPRVEGRRRRQGRRGARGR